MEDDRKAAKPNGGVATATSPEQFLGLAPRYSDIGAGSPDSGTSEVMRNSKSSGGCSAAKPACIRQRSDSSCAR